MILTISGNENRYARWLYRHWGHLKSIEFAGFMSREQLYRNYASAHCLVFPSRVETWGLPISEFAAFGKPMLLADLPYAHETAAGSRQTAFFNPQSSDTLKIQMKHLIEGDFSFLKEIPYQFLQNLPQTHGKNYLICYCDNIENEKRKSKHSSTRQILSN